MGKGQRPAAIAALAIVGMLVSSGDVAQGQGRGTVSSASGGFQVTFGGQTRTIQFTAQKDSTNTTRGQGHLFNHVTGTKLHLEIDCLHVVGSVATVSGVFSQSNNPTFPEDMPFWMQVVDNGEGGKKPVDLTSSVQVFIGPGVPCTATALPAALPIEGGNIQVR